MTVESTFLHVIISLVILLFAAKLMVELFHRIRLPVVLGELLAGVMVGPFAVGGLLITLREFLSVGAASFTVGSIGVVVPFFIGYCGREVPFLYSLSHDEE